MNSNNSEYIYHDIVTPEAAPVVAGPTSNLRCGPPIGVCSSVPIGNSSREMSDTNKALGDYG